MEGSLKCAGLAACSGLLVSASNNVVAYAQHVAAKRNVELGRRTTFFLFLLNVLLNLAGIAFFLFACKFGPVAVAMPMVTALKLLSNMVFQFSRGIAHYTKPMRVGTYVLAIAIFCLPEVGPTDPKDAIDIEWLLSQRLTQLWLESLVLVLASALVVLRFIGRDQTELTIFVLSVVVADSTSLAATVGKMLSVASGNLFTGCLFLYLALGSVSFIWGAIAAFEVDMSLYLPLSECLQLLINGATGAFVWGDGLRLQEPVSYGMVYILIGLSVYLCSSYDYYSEANAKVFVAGGSSGAASSSFELAMPANRLRVKGALGAWAEGANPRPTGLVRALRRSLREGNTNNDGLVEFCGDLAEEVLRRGASPQDLVDLLYSTSERCNGAPSTLGPSDSFLRQFSEPLLR